MLLRLVHSLDSFEDAHRTAIFLRRADEGLHILGEARASIATARVEELTPDTGVTTDALTHHGDVGTDGFAEVRHLIHEADARSEHSVGRILRDLCRGDIHEEDAEVIEEDGLVEARHQLTGTVAIDTDDDSVGAHEVLDSVALLEELGVRSDVEGNGHTTLTLCRLDRLTDLEVGAYGHGALGDDETIVRHRLTDSTSYGEDVAQVGRAIFVWGRADSTEDNLDMGQDFGDRGREVQASSLHSTAHEGVQTRLIDGYLPITQALDLRLIDIYTVDFYTEVSEASCADQSDIAYPYDSNGHNATPYYICIGVTSLGLLHAAHGRYAPSLRQEAGASSSSQYPPQH